jgi:hypothetical protein
VQMETVLNKPLSGEEIKLIILDKFRLTLDGDQRLSNHFAFPAFSFHGDIAIVLQGAVHDTVERTVDGGRGSVTDSPDTPASFVTAHVEQESMPPNQARVEAGLGVPVLGHDATGRPVEKEVKYPRNHQINRRQRKQAQTEVPTVTVPASEAVDEETD